MARPLVSDALWEQIEALLPEGKPRRFRYPGRKRLEPRKILTGIIFVLKTGIPWEDLPMEMGCGCGMTCLNYLKAWQAVGVWENLHHLLLHRNRGRDVVNKDVLVGIRHVVWRKRRAGGLDVAVKQPVEPTG